MASSMASRGRTPATPTPAPGGRRGQAATTPPPWKPETIKLGEYIGLGQALTSGGSDNTEAVRLYRLEDDTEFPAGGPRRARKRVGIQFDCGDMDIIDLDKLKAIVDALYELSVTEEDDVPSRDR